MTAPLIFLLPFKGYVMLEYKDIIPGMRIEFYHTNIDKRISGTVYLVDNYGIILNGCYCPNRKYSDNVTWFSQFISDIKEINYDIGI